MLEYLHTGRGQPPFEWILYTLVGVYHQPASIVMEEDIELALPMLTCRFVENTIREHKEKQAGQGGGAKPLRSLGSANPTQ